MFTEHDGDRLFSTTVGSGPDLVLLHPTPTHHAFWLPLADHLLPDAGHYAPLQQPRRVAAILEEFLSRLPLETSAGVIH